jgi:glutamate-5-semialdehyde dehydrogenase
MDLANQILQLGQRARAAARILARLPSEQKNTGLRAMADALLRHQAPILSANSKDVATAHANGLVPAMIDRLRLDEKRLAAMAQGVRDVAALPDPVGETIKRWTRPNGIEISKVRVPIGVVGIIYESRPNVTSDAAVLCTKTGNATILRGGSESLQSNLAIADALRAGAAQTGLPEDSILLIPRTDREAVRLLAEMDQYVDMIVPRGGKALIEAVVRSARMPVIKHYTGLCLLYIDRAADLDMAVKLTVNTKCQRPGVCNAVETLLVHRDIAPAFLPRAAEALRARQVELRADEETRRILGEGAGIIPAVPEDWDTEFLDLRLAVKVTADMDEAIAHIETHGSHHSDAIVTADAAAAERFLNEVDSATVYWNASTRFTDGGEFGFGAEIGISTDKLHARGPMALEELTTYKYVIRGEGQVRE